MSDQPFTKLQEDRIRSIIREEFGKPATNDNPLAHIDFEKWKAEGTKSELTGLIIPKEDLVLANGKRFFTWDEMMELQKYLPEGWRIAPTIKEWTLLSVEFGMDEDGEQNGELMNKNLGLAFNGWVPSCDMGKYNESPSDDLVVDAENESNYWSSTVQTAAWARVYNADTTDLYVRNAYYKYDGFSVRCILR